MKHTNKFKALSMIYLVLTISFMLPLAIGQSTPPPNTPPATPPPTIPPPGDQCTNKVAETSALVDILDNEIVRYLEIISSALFAIATIINTIDYFISLVSSIVGMAGPSPANMCCTIGLVSAGGACGALYSKFSFWQDFKGNPVVSGIVSVATCECCSGARGKDARGDGVGGGAVAVAGGAGGLCPAGFLGDKLGGMLGGESHKGQKSDQGGISQFGVSAFDNIYLAIGCLCPIAILHNLRKLKTIYQVNECCIQESCRNGVSTEACSQQLDEALCQYWEGSAMRAVLQIITSIVAGYISGMVTKWIEKTVLAKLAACATIILELTQIPSRIQAIFGAFDWFQSSLASPDDLDCSQLGFDKIEDQLQFNQDFGESVFPGSLPQGITATTTPTRGLDSNGDGIVDSITS